MRLFRVFLLAPLSLFAACTGSPNGNDGGDGGDAAAEAGVCSESTPIHSLYPGPLYVRVDGSAEVLLRLSSDRFVCGADYTITSENPAVLSAPEMAHIDRLRGSVQFTVRGVSLGRTRLRVAQVGSTDMRAQASIDVVVMAPERPACPVTTPEVTLRLAPGARASGPAGSPLEAVSVSAPAMATNIPATDVRVGCAADQVPDGYDAIGPAISFGPGVTRFAREVTLTIPINPSLVPSLYELHTEVAWTGPGGWSRPRIVALADTRFTQDGRALTFRAMRLGTYQAVVRRGLGQTRVRRRFTYRAILGVSMGGLGSSMIGTRHPELFDMILPLGPAIDFGFMGDFYRRYLFGGFCTAEERTRKGEMACSAATNARTPEPNDLFIADENFEFFNFPTGTQGQGGTIDRRAYVQIFRDVTRMFGNPFMYADPANGVLPMGVPASELTRSDEDRCANPISLGGRTGAPRFYDDEYNPTGEYPVITFCDGNRTPENAGEWAGGQGTYPFEVALAVDLNRNGIRDRGEPVIRNFGEKFDDWGRDGVPSTREPGYDPATNPDPAGDDFDRQYNPAGTEGNFLYEMGEPFEDLGLDGVRCPAGETCPYDFGEGNGRWDATPGVQNFLSHNARELFARLPREEADRLQVWADGGVRDFYNFGASSHYFAGGVQQAGTDLHVFSRFSSLIARIDPETIDDAQFDFTSVDYLRLPRHALLRYGHEDITMAQYLLGDGGHVGTAEQITNRLYTALWSAQARWPNGDRTIQAFSSTPDNEGRCANGYFCTFDFHSERANRTGPVSIYLPPGYHRAENRNVTYPVVFVLHGYGQEPMDLIASGLLVGNFMSSARIADWQRPAKYIMVFPDGRCRAGDGCIRGTFYTDSPNGNAQMEQYFLDLYEYIQRNYRARPPEEVEVIE